MADMNEIRETKDDCTVEEKLKTETFPQDKGWAWVIVIACFGVLGFIVGGLKSFGVLLVELTRQTDGPAKVVTSTQSLAGFLHVALGTRGYAPVANILSERFSHRIVIIAGGVIAGIGFITTSFVQDIGWVFVTYGLVAGIGFGLALSPSLVMMGYHFDKRKALANGLADSGIGVSSFVFPNILRVVINEYGLNGCFLIFGAIMFNICVCGCLFRPLEFWQKKKLKLSVEGEPLLEINKREIELSDIPHNGTMTECDGELYRQKNKDISEDFKTQSFHKEVADDKTVVPKQIDGGKHSKALEDKKGCCSSFTLEWRYLKNIHFLLFTFGLCFGVIGQHTVFNCLPSLAGEMSFSDQDGAFLVSVVGISDMAGKIFFGWFSDLGILKRQTVFHLNVGIFSIFAFLFPFIGIYIVQCVISVFAGFFSGGFLGIEIAVLADKFGTENLPSTWGFVAVFGSIAMLINPFIAGLLKDITGTWRSAFYFCSASALFGFLLLLIDVFIEKSKTKKKTISQTSDNS